VTISSEKTSLKTDHKPLVTLLGSKNLDKLPARVLRFRMRLLRFTYSIMHVPSKNLMKKDGLRGAERKGPSNRIFQWHLN